MSKRVLVTGGAGFIGSHVVRRLLELGHEVTVYDSFVHYIHPLAMKHVQNIQARLEPIQDRARLVRGSTQNLDSLLRVLLDAKPHRLIHLAAMPLPKLAHQHPEEAASSILQGTLNIFQAARHVDCMERVTYVSSSMVYGDFRQDPASEDHPTAPKDVYGGLKLSGEILTRTYAQRYGLDFTVIRPSAVYGPTDNNSRVVSIFIESALKGEPLRVFGEESVLDFTYVSDTADGIATAALHPNASTQTFNLTFGRGRALAEAARIVADLVPGTEIQIMKEENNVPARGTLDITRARELIGYEPKVCLEEGISRYLDYVKRSF